VERSPARGPGPAGRWHRIGELLAPVAVSIVLVGCGGSPATFEPSASAASAAEPVSSSSSASLLPSSTVAPTQAPPEPVSTAQPSGSSTTSRRLWQDRPDWTV